MDSYDSAIEHAMENGQDPQEYVNRKTGHDEFQALLERYWIALQEPMCDECEHAVALHRDQYGCQHEHGDAWVEGQGEGMGTYVAQGPCGCTAIKFCENCGDYPCICHNHECQQCGKVLEHICVCQNPNRMDWCSSNCRAAFDL